MNNKGDAITLDDVLDFYLISTEEAGTDALNKIIELYPQYENELREFAALRRISDKLPDREYTEEEEDLLNARAVSIAQNLLYQKRQEGASAERAEAPSSLRDEIDRQYASPEEFYQKTGLSEGIIWTLDLRQVAFETISRKAIENIADALGKSFCAVVRYLRGKMKITPSHYKAGRAPEVTSQYTFYMLVGIDEDLTEEQKEYWLAQPPIGAGEECKEG